MWEARVGMKCVCVSDLAVWETALDWGVAVPLEGYIYTIRDVVEGFDAYEGQIFLRVMEIVNEPSETYAGPLEAAFSIKHFRPLRERKSDISIFRAILNGHRVPEGV